MRITLLCVGLAISFVGFTQSESNTKFRRMKINSVELSTSLLYGEQSFRPLTDYQNMALNNDFPILDMEGYNSASNYYGNIIGAVNLALEFNLFNKAGVQPWGRPTFRVGMSHTWNNTSNLGFFNSNRYPYDSLYTTFQGTTTVTAVDSIRYGGRTFSANSNRIRLNAAALWHSNPEKRWSFYMGIGIGLGASINSTLTVHQYEGYEIDFGHPTSGYFLEPNYIYSNMETIRGKTWFDFNLIVPVGVELKLSKKDNLFKHAHLFFEFAPTLWMNTAPGVSAQYSMLYSFTNGIRIKF